MAERTTYCTLDVQYVGLNRKSAPRVVTYREWAVGIGPAYDGGSADLDIVPSASLTGLVDVTSVPADGTSLSIGWPVYNGITGDNPSLLHEIVITLTPTDTGDVVDGTVTITGPNCSTVIYISGIADAPDILDNFNGTVGTWLRNHSPDVAPGGGAITGWHGTAADNKGELDGSGRYVIGGSSGSSNLGRLYLGRHDKFFIYADIRRQGSGSWGTAGLVVRCEEVSGYVDTDCDSIWFYFSHYDDDNVRLSWEQRQANSTVLQSDSNFLTLAWALWAEKRLIIRVDGDTLRLYTADVGTWDNLTLRRTVTLSTTWNDASHDYVGMRYVHMNQGLAYLILASGQVLLEAASASVAFEGEVDSATALESGVDFSHTPVDVALGNLSANVVYEDGDGWLDATLEAATSPTTLTLVPDLTGLAVGVYHATVTVDSPDQDGDPVEVAVTLTVFQLPSIALDQTTVAFEKQVASGDPPTQDVAVTNDGSGTLDNLALSAVRYGDGEPTGWLTPTLNDTVAPTTVTLAAATGSLPVGTYTAEVDVESTADGIVNSPQTITVTFTVFYAPVIAADPVYLQMSLPVGDSSLSDTVDITNAGEGTLNGLSVGTVTYDPAGTAWLAATLDTATAPAVLTLVATRGALASGTYRATVPILSSAGHVLNSPLNVVVDFVVPTWLPPSDTSSDADGDGKVDSGDEAGIPVWRVPGEASTLESRFGVEVASGGETDVQYGSGRGVVRLQANEKTSSWSTPTDSTTHEWTEPQ